MIRTQVTGLAELGAATLRLERDLQEQILRAATAAAGSVIRKEMEIRAPFKSGRLRRSVFIKRKRSPGPGRQEYVIGVRRGKRYQSITLKYGKAKGQTVDMDGFHGKFFEFGTKKMAARPFARPSIEAKRGEAIEAFKKRMRAGLARHGAKL